MHIYNVHFFLYSFIIEYKTNHEIQGRAPTYANSSKWTRLTESINSRFERKCSDHCYWNINKRAFMARNCLHDNHRNSLPCQLKSVCLQNRKLKSKFYDFHSVVRPKVSKQRSKLNLHVKYSNMVQIPENSHKKTDSQGQPWSKLKS